MIKILTSIVPWIIAIISVVVSINMYRLSKRRDKDAAMTQLNKDIAETRTDIAAIKERLQHMPTTFEVFTSINSAKKEIIDAISNRKP